MSFKEIWDRERENLTMLIVSFFAWVVFSKFDILSLKVKIGVEFAFVMHLISFYILYLILYYLYQKYAVQNRINIIKSRKYFDEHFTELLDGRKFYGYLAVEIPSDWIITDCYVTLEHVFPIYYGDKILLDRKTSEWFSSKNKPENKMLRWRSPLSYENKTKINIGENSNKESFSIGKIVTGKFSNLDINTFNFDVPQKTFVAIEFNKFGLYEFSIEFHWKRHGRNMIPKKANGYIYSRSMRGIREIRVGLGDYNNDNDIPKPLLKKEG